MEKLAYFLIALRYDSSTNLNRYIDFLKDSVNSLNYKETREDSNTKVLLHNISNSSIKIILRIESSFIKTKETVIMHFKDEVNTVLSNNMKLKKDTILDTLYEMELEESIVNKVILKMKKNKISEFDLLAALKFNNGIKNLLNNNLADELKINMDSDNGSRSRNRFNRNENDKDMELKYINYNEEKLNMTIEEVQSSVIINLDIKNELKFISKICNKLKNSLNYILTVDHLDLCEMEIAKMIFSEQYKVGIFKKTNFSTVVLDEIISPPRSHYYDGNSEEIELDFEKKGMGIIIKGLDGIDQIDELELNKLISFINNETVPFILLSEESKIRNNEKYRINIIKLKESIICGQIKISQPTAKMFAEKIIKEVENKNYLIDKNFNIQNFITCLEKQYVKGFTISKVKEIANKIIYNHEMIEDGRIIYNLNINGNISENTNKKEMDGDLETGLQKLDNLVGLDNLKFKVKQFIALNKVNEARKKMGLESQGIYKHMCLKGNPGSGKTTFARIFAQIMREEGLLEKGDLIEVSRDDLVAKYVGWTAKTVTGYFEKARGSVLFIDEAYLLNSDFKTGYGDEAIGTIVKNMENYKDVIVIMAGYPNEMNDFVDANPGMESRIGLYIDMKDFKVDELIDIFIRFSEKRQYVVSKDVIDRVYCHLSKVALNKPSGFGNARYVRRLFERLQLSQANRISIIDSINKEDLLQIIIDDMSFLDDEADFHYKEEIKRIGFTN